MNLRRRIRVSFVVFILGLATLYGLWTLARNSPRVDGTPVAFRQMLTWNGELWRKLYCPKRPNRHAAPAAGQAPRVNGDIGLNDDYHPKEWIIDVSSDQGPSKMITLDQLKALPQVETSSLFFCIEGWSEPVSYKGVRFSDFLSRTGFGTRSGKTYDPAHPEDLYRYVGLETPDGEYYVSIDMESMLHPQTLLAFEQNGQPLAPANGAPLRLMIPVKYGVKNLKRIGNIRFSDTRPPDYWTEQGYDWFAGL